MNVISRGIKNTLRSPLRSGAIVLMLAISVGLILSMLVARNSVNAKIDEVKATVGTNITINPAGIRGFSGGGDLLTSDQVAKITSTAHVSKTVSTLNDQLNSSDTNLQSSLNLGSFGRRQRSVESGTPTDTTQPQTTTQRPMMTPRITITGTTDPNSVSSNGSNLTITSGTTINGSSSDLVAIVGDSLATKNSLTVGSKFTAYTKEITVAGIFKTGNTFQDSGMIMPLSTIQTLTSQPGSISDITATIDSADNVNGVIAALTTSLGSSVDITSQAKQAEASVASLESISSLALAGVIGATVAGAAIVLISMVMIVRERRREIGVIKAIGGSNIKVMSQFITEALTLTIIGAFVGLAFGVFVSGLITSSLVSSSAQSSSQTAQNGMMGGFGGGFRNSFNQINTSLTNITTTVTPQIFIYSICITLLIAIIGSAIPAWLIARIRPAEVLRSE